MSIDNTPFDDSFVKSSARSTVDQSSPTAGYDAYRQGVELTLTRHYVQGIVKIHAGYHGENGDHTVPQLSFGQSQVVTSNEPYFRDVVPSTLVGFFDRSSSTVSLPLDRTTDLDVATDLFDGVVEPFDIRDVVALKDEKIRYGHKVWAVLDEGNVANRRSSDVFVYIVKDTDIRVGSFPMVDSSDHMSDINTAAESISVDSRVCGPFIEDYSVKGVMLSFSMDDDMITALNSMKPGTDNLVGYTQLGTTGFDY